MTTVRLDIEYDGAGFRGWARQPSLRTVQGVLEAGLAQILREEIELTVAGRTDTGVHALGQVASFDTEATLPARPGPQPERGHARTTSPCAAPRPSPTASTPAATPARAPTSTGWRRARHRARSSRAGRSGGRTEVDRAALDACAAALVGTHDFTAFTPTQTDHVRFERDVLAASWQEESAHILAFRITADAFMRSMVRALVGTMLQVALENRTVENFNALLEGASRSEGGRHRPTPRSVPGVGRLRLRRPPAR